MNDFRHISKAIPVLHGMIKARYGVLDSICSVVRVPQDNCFDKSENVKTSVNRKWLKRGKLRKVGLGERNCLGGCTVGYSSPMLRYHLDQPINPNQLSRCPSWFTKSRRRAGNSQHSRIVYTSIPQAFVIPKSQHSIIR